MTDQEINVAIAEACGWRQRTEGMMWSEVLHCAKIIRGSELERVRRQMGLPMENALLPNYCTDLNAMHDAEETLSDNERDRFRDHLAMMTTLRRYPKDLDSAKQYCRENEWAYIHSTARQRAEAFLRVKGLWREWLMKHANLKVEFRCSCCGKLVPWIQQYQCSILGNNGSQRLVHQLCKSCYTKGIRVVKR